MKTSRVLNTFQALNAKVPGASQMNKNFGKLRGLTQTFNPCLHPANNANMG